MCVRDDQGQFVMARTEWWRMNLQIVECEACGLLNALHWIIVGLQNIIFELDCKQLVVDVSRSKIIR
jgi:hypothetical protein